MCTQAIIRSAVIGIVVTLMLAGCQRGGGGASDDTDDTDDSDSNSEPTDSDTHPCGTNDPTLRDGNADTLFSIDRIPSLELHLPAADWEALQADAVAEEYVAARLCMDGVSVGRVGLRFKGAYGSLLNCFTETGDNICRKLGLKIKFNEYDEDNRFFGLKRLNLQGNRYDDSYMRETLSYRLFRSLDVDAPRAAFAEVHVNGELMGLYGMVEEVDGRFTDDRWPDNGDGNLFKEVWPGNASGESALEHLKTNEEAADVTAFMAFSDALSAADETTRADVLAAHMDVNHLARYMAVDDAIANFDGITTWYSSADATLAGNHNFYIYEASESLYTLIPWDLESTLSLSTGFGDVPHWTQGADCQTVYPVWNGANQVIAPSCDPLFAAMADNLTPWRDAIDDLLGDAFTVEAMDAAIDAYAAAIEEAVARDPHGPGEAAWRTSVAAIRAEIPLLRERLQLLQSGTAWTPFKVSTDAVNDLEEQDSFGLRMGTQLLCNAASTVAVSVNETDPLNGTRDLRMDFAFGNEAAGWNQWNFYQVPVVDAPFDAGALSGIRMTLQADQDRTLRFDITSAADTAAAKGIFSGWSIPVTADAATVEVLFADAAPPSWAVDNGTAPDDSLADILASVTGIRFFPQCAGRSGTTGQLPDGTLDEGFLSVDDIEFF